VDHPRRYPSHAFEAPFLLPLRHSFIMCARAGRARLFPASISSTFAWAFLISNSVKSKHKGERGSESLEYNVTASLDAREQKPKMGVSPRSARKEIRPNFGRPPIVFIYPVSTVLLACPTLSPATAKNPAELLAALRG
jgi:hypothetical protein